MNSALVTSVIYLMRSSQDAP